MKTHWYIKSVYEEAGPEDGFRVLVDRLWPRGLTKEKVGCHEWAKDLAPSTALRKWFGHDPQRWEAFQNRYREELHSQPGLAERVAAWAKQERLTLVYAARDRVHNHAWVLLKFLQEVLDQQKR